MIPTYVINLLRSSERREHMQQLLQAMPWAEGHFVDAVDGRALTPQQLGERFDTRRAFELLGREVVAGEIGCTLSHRECYRRLLASQDEFALIMEDDVVMLGDPGGVINDVLPLLRGRKPVWLALGGAFHWLYARRMGSARVGRVWGGWLASAYMVNRAAAERLLGEHPWWLADDLHLFGQMGVHTWGLIPHVFEQANAQYDSEIGFRVATTIATRSFQERWRRRLGRWGRYESYSSM